MIAGATKKKTDKLDAERLSFYDLTEVWDESYDEFTSQADYFLQLIRRKVFSMEWETNDGFLPGDEMVRILCSTPGVGEITCFSWLAFVATPRRFRNAKALAAYAGLDPSLKVSAGKITSSKKRGGCHILHKILVTGADRIMRTHREAFGRCGAKLLL